MKQQDPSHKHRGTKLEQQLQRAVQRLKAARRFASEDCEPCEVLPGLFLGSIGAARNLEALQRAGISHVLNASPIVPCFHRRVLRYKTVAVYDDAAEDIAQFFEEANAYISKGRRKGGVLVHCYAGMSRSATLALAHLIASEGMSLGEALHRTRKARPCVAPNAGFMLQLEAWAQRFQAQRQPSPFQLLPLLSLQDGSAAAAAADCEGGSPLAPDCQQLFRSQLLARS